MTNKVEDMRVLLNEWGRSTIGGVVSGNGFNMGRIKQATMETAEDENKEEIAENNIGIPEKEWPG